ATGSAPLAYQWRRDGVDIPGATGPSFEKSGATPADSGNYSVRVANAAGSAESAPAALLVLAPPVITRQPAPLTLLAGLAATFTVEAAGSGTLTYQWFREEVALEGASGPVLNLSSLLVSDTATYRVRVGNLAGEALSTAVLLTVVTPPTILGPPVSQVAAAGAPVTLSVVAAGTGPLAYQWARNGVPLPSATSPALAIAAVSAADAGSYTVTVSNPHGTATPPAATLDVDLPVEFEGVAVDGYIAGATVFFDALRNGTPDPGEPFARTDAQGRFRLDIPLGRFDLNRNGRLDPEEGRLVRLGGIDVATGLAARFPATGPVGAGVLGPLSSLVDTLQASQPRLSVAEAESLVARSLGLPEDTAVTRVDPIQAAAQGQSAAIALLNAAAQVQDTLVQVASVLDAAAGGSSTAPGTVLDTLARSVLEARPLDLTEPGQIQEILQQAARKEGLEIPAGVADATAQVVAEGNQAKETATQSGDPRQVAEQISRIQSVAQGSTTRDLAEAATGRQDETEVLARNTGGPLQQLVAQAPAGDLLGTG
ncbi:MAG: immunoglobulin domain-containing protein, partial [Verrucomicrobiota bacterium]